MSDIATDPNAQQGTRLFRLVGRIFLAVAIVLIGVCYVTVRNSQRFLASAERAEGTVVALSRSSGNRSDGTVYHPVVTFRTSAGETVEFISSWGSRPAPYRRGDAVTVLYQASDPNGARIEAFFSLWGASLITGGLGSVFLILAIVLLKVAGRPPPR